LVLVMFDLLGSFVRFLGHLIDKFHGYTVNH
jgi:hypothetical protein